MVGFISVSRQKEENPYGAALGQGVAQGITARLNDMLEEKQYQKGLARQKEEWKPIAQAYAKATGKPGLAKLYEELGPQGTKLYSLYEKQQAEQAQRQSQARKLAAETSKLESEAQMYKDFLGQEPRSLGFDEMSETQSLPRISKMLGSDQDILNQDMSNVEQEIFPQKQKTLPSKQKQGVQPIVPKKGKQLPPFGPFAQAAAIQQREYQSDVKRAFDETKEFRKDIEKKGKSADQSIKTLDFMDKLVNTGKLSNPILAKTADLFGLVGLLSPESQLFEKAMGQFLPSMADTYGARVTNQHEKIFLNTLPRLSQSDSGKKVLISMLKKQAEADKIRKNHYQQILKETNNIPPYNIEELVEDRAKDDLERNYREYLNIATSGVKQGTPIGRVTMLDTNGEVYDIPESEVEMARKAGLEVLE